jgi:hypothetical protein
VKDIHNFLKNIVKLKHGLFGLFTYSLREIGKTLKRRFSNDGPRQPQELPNAQSQDKQSRWKSFHMTSKDNET